jgi:hypothetical protein
VPHRTLTITSLLAMVLMTLHIVDDIKRGISPPSTSLGANIVGPIIFLVWLIGTLMLTGRRSGYVIMLLGGLMSALMPVLHMRGAGYPRIVASDGGFFFVWTLYAVGSLGAFAVILAAQALWRSRTPRHAPEVTP